MSYAPLDPKLKLICSIVRWPVAVPKKLFVILAEWAFLIVAALVAAAYLWAVAFGLE